MPATLSAAPDALLERSIANPDVAPARASLATRLRRPRGILRSSDMAPAHSSSPPQKSGEAPGPPHVRYGTPAAAAMASAPGASGIVAPIPANG